MLLLFFCTSFSQSRSSPSRNQVPSSLWDDKHNTHGGYSNKCDFFKKQFSQFLAVDILEHKNVHLILSYSKNYYILTLKTGNLFPILLNNCRKMSNLVVFFSYLLHQECITVANKLMQLHLAILIWKQFLIALSLVSVLNHADQ